MKSSVLLIFALIPFFSSAQFAPPAGQVGSTAIPADSSIFVNWAIDATIERGWINVSDQSLGKADVGTPEDAIGTADGVSVVSLGDGGIATLTFEKPIRDGVGFDFAVFENGFVTFLELAVVEVSSDGENFVRFPATSNTSTDEQTGGFGWTDATLINNLAGKYVANFGTPFDLEELAGTPNLDLQKITHVRLIDVVGSIDPDFATFDQNDHAINDPFPTPFPSAGFDLDAVGVINQNDLTSIENIDNQQFEVSFRPNPVPQGQSLIINNPTEATLYLYDAFGTFVQELTNASSFSTADLAKGVYFLHSGKTTQKILIF